MFCFKCGKHIRDDAVFCPYCGISQNQGDDGVSARTNTGRKSSDGELDREALKIYLGNILSLECCKAKYNREISELTYNISQHSNNDYIIRYVLREGISGTRYAHFRYSEHGISFLGDAYSRPDPNWFESTDAVWYKVSRDGDIDYLKKASDANWHAYTDYSAGFLRSWEQREESRDAFFQAYEDFKSVAPKRYRNNVETNTKKVNNWQQQINGRKEELQTIEKLLKEAYDINIIPSQFRHEIHALYYLHEFVSTSQESFTTALLHLDLDEIKTKLDKIIAQQEAIIIQNAMMIAQNEQLVRQNQQQLEQLSRIEGNTSQAAQYAQIASNYAGVCAWISTSNYIEAHR